MVSSSVIDGATISWTWKQIITRKGTLKKRGINLLHTMMGSVHLALQNLQVVQMVLVVQVLHEVQEDPVVPSLL